MTGVPAGGGVLPVDKPPGPTSHDVVDRVRRILGVRRVGHTGTLDPFASGLLLVCVGPATRLSEYLTGLDKEYLATARLGVRTRTHDTEGEVVDEHGGWADLDARRIGEVLERYRGTIRQRPPAFSAKKISGEAAHRKARRGERVELEPVEVTVHSLTLVEMRLPEVVLHVRCSSGTYVRALARDLGDALGVGAHLTGLRRTAVGTFAVEGAVGLESLDAGTAARAWISPADALAHLGRIEVEEDDARRLRHGQRIRAEGARERTPGPVLVLLGERLVAVGERDGDEVLPRKVFS